MPVTCYAACTTPRTPSSTLVLLGLGSPINLFNVQKGPSQGGLVTLGRIPTCMCINTTMFQKLPVFMIFFNALIFIRVLAGFFPSFLGDTYFYSIHSIHTTAMLDLDTRGNDLIKVLENHHDHHLKKKET